MSYVVNMSSDVMWYACHSGHAIYRGSRGNIVRSSRIRHQNAFTEKAWEDAVQGLGKIKDQTAESVEVIAPKKLPELKLENFFNFVWA